MIKHRPPRTQSGRPPRPRVAKRVDLAREYDEANGCPAFTEMDPTHSATQAAPAREAQIDDVTAPMAPAPKPLKWWQKLFT